MTWAAAGVVIAAIAGQAFWIAHALEAMRRDLGGRLDRIDARLDLVEQTVLRELGERVARLEERTGA
jgi:hypothetical protein